jgi:hypothetical protein
LTKRFARRGATTEHSGGYGCPPFSIQARQSGVSVRSQAAA